MKVVALTVISLYQRYVSPYKGFCCAYRAQTGHASCSSLGYRAIRRFGVWRGVSVLRNRLGKCGVAYRSRFNRPVYVNRQSGHCDLSCDLPCDFDCGSAAGDILSSCTSPGDCGDLWSSKKRNEGDLARSDRNYFSPSPEQIMFCIVAVCAVVAVMTMVSFKYL